MTDLQKMAITDYRRCGYGYKKISQLLVLSENTVKTFCRRNGLCGVASHAIETACQSCGKPIIQTPGRKTKKFCSDHCRSVWWNDHPDQVKHKTTHTFICPGCGKPLTVYGSTLRKYCTHECFIRDRFGGGRRDK